MPLLQKGALLKYGWLLLGAFSFGYGATQLEQQIDQNKEQQNSFGCGSTQWHQHIDQNQEQQNSQWQRADDPNRAFWLPGITWIPSIAEIYHLYGVFCAMICLLLYVCSIVWQHMSDEDKQAARTFCASKAKSACRKIRDCIAAFTQRQQGRGQRRARTGAEATERPVRRARTEGGVALEPAFFIRNVGHPCFLDSYGTNVQVWGDGVDVGTIPDNLKWILRATGEPETYFIVHHRHNGFLAFHGGQVKLWEDGVDVSWWTSETLVKTEWRFEPVEDIPNAYYLIHKATNKFLDTLGLRGSLGGVQLWGDGINRGPHPRNLQWQFQRA